MHLSVFFQKKELRMSLEILFPRMFQYQPSSGIEQLLFKYQVGQFFYVRQVVWRVGEDDVKRAGGMPQEGEGIGAYHLYLRHVQLPQCVPDKTDMPVVDLHEHDPACAARGELITDAAGTGEKVKHSDLLQVEMVLQDGEKRLLGHVRSGTGLQCPGRMDPVFPVFPAYYTHVWRLKRLAKECSDTMLNV